MLETWWSLKGGVGVSVAAAAHAVATARRGRSTVLVDLCGDQPALLGTTDSTGPGVWDWIDADAGASALARLCVPLLPQLMLLPAGHSRAHRGPDPPAADGHAGAAAAGLATALGGLADQVVVDAGSVGGRFSEPGHVELVRALADAGRSLLVTRPCYLALRRGVRGAGDVPRADGVVLVADAGRTLDRKDVETVLSLPVLAELEGDPSVARCADAGLLLRRPPRVLERGLRRLA